jgi:hypothetical protein
MLAHRAWASLVPEFEAFKIYCILNILEEKGWRTNAFRRVTDITNGTQTSARRSFGAVPQPPSDILKPSSAPLSWTTSGALSSENFASSGRATDL